MIAESLPDTVQAWLDSWAGKLRSEVEVAMAEAKTHEPKLPKAQSPITLPSKLLVGTDCSGLEAPIHALSQLQVNHIHRWSSELALAPRQVILCNTPPEHLYDNVIESAKRDVPYVHMYISGFSCKPFSMLHHNTKLLEEEEAKIFWAVRDRLHRVRPACFVLENVLGIRRVLNEVVAALEGGGLYHVSICEMDSSHLQEPCRRPRLYLLGARTDVALGDAPALQRVVDRAWQRVKEAYAMGPKHTLQDRMLPTCHPAVQKYQAFRNQRWCQARLQSTFHLEGIY